MAAAEIQLPDRVTQPGVSLSEPRDLETARRRRVQRAIEAYKAACTAEGREPTEEDSWLVLLAALHMPE